MAGTQFEIIAPEDKDKIELIAHWYLSEWNIPLETTIEKIKKLSARNIEFQVLMTLDNVPIATGGLYKHVGLIDKVPRLKIYNGSSRRQIKSE